MRTRNRESGHERTETLPCIKRLPINGPTIKSGRRAEFRKAQTYRWRSKNRDRYNRTCVNSCGASGAKPPNHSSALARAPRLD